MVELRGSYRYATPEALEAAVRSALLHASEADDDHDCAEWLRTLTRRGTRLEVRATLTPDSDPFLAASLLSVLSEAAIEGAVDVRRGDKVVDCFGSGDADD
ncbi:hypothetical protein BH11MYX1_BH11MYX1_12010 [soil metagenome]